MALRDIVLNDFPVVYADQALRSAWKTVVESPAERMPVLNSAADRRMIGVVQKSNLLRQAGELFV